MASHNFWMLKSPFCLIVFVFVFLLNNIMMYDHQTNHYQLQQQHFSSNFVFSFSIFFFPPNFFRQITEAAYAYNAKKPRSRLNKQLAKYLERESYDADHGGLTLGPFGGYEFDEDSNKLLLPSQYQEDRNKLLLPSSYQEDRKRSSVFRERSSLYGKLFACKHNPWLWLCYTKGTSPLWRKIWNCWQQKTKLIGNFELNSLNMKGSLNIASIKQKVEDNLHAVEQIL